MILLPVLLLLVLSLYFIKGTPIHEVMHLPQYWKQVQQVPKLATFRKLIYGDHPRQYTLQCTPPPTSILKNLYVIYFHGGGWRFGSPEMLQGIAHKLASKGYRSFLPSHRRTPNYAYPDIKQDLIHILNQISTTLAKQEGDTFSVVIGGVSAGGNVAALAALDEEIWQSAGLTQNQLAGLFLLAAPLELNTMPRSPVVYSFAGKRKSDQFYKANPINYIRAGLHLPIFCIHGTKDGLVPHKGSYAFREALHACGHTQLDFHIVPGATHLDMAGWIHTEGPTQTAFFNWLYKINSEELPPLQSSSE